MRLALQTKSEKRAQRFLCQVTCFGIADAIAHLQGLLRHACLRAGHHKANPEVLRLGVGALSLVADQAVDEVQAVSSRDHGNGAMVQKTVAA